MRCFPKCIAAAGIKINSEEDAERALVALHRLGPQVSRQRGLVRI